MEFTLQNIANAGHREACVRAIDTKCGDARVGAGDNNASGAARWNWNVDNFAAAEFECSTLKHADSKHLHLCRYWCATPNQFSFYVTTDKCDTIDGALAPLHFAWCPSTDGGCST